MILVTLSFDFFGSTSEGSFIIAMVYVLVSSDDFHRGPTRVSSVDPYLHEKLPLNVIKDTIFYQVIK